MIVRACSSSRSSRAFPASSAAMRRCSGLSFTFRPRRRPSASSAPASRSRRQVVRCELYSPSRRNSAPLAPGFVHRSASSSTESLYAALNCRRFATARTSASGAALGAAAAEIIFSFLLSDIVRLPLDSNSRKVGVSRHIGTNGGPCQPFFCVGQTKIGEHVATAFLCRDRSLTHFPYSCS